MITSTSAANAASSPADYTYSGTTTAGSMDSFAQHLMGVIEDYLGKSGSNGHLQIDIQNSSQSQNSDTRQFIVTVKNADSSSAPATTSPKAATKAVLSTPMSWTPADVSDPPAPTTPTDAVTNDKSQMSPDDAYWAMQPPAVQALRNMPDAERGTQALALAQQGYKIDVPIMVWGWNPLATMVQRQIDGYTWVPSALQDSIPIGPGLTFPGRVNYDPNNPPPGSIMVNTDFAIGTNGQNPAMKYVNNTSV